MNIQHIILIGFKHVGKSTVGKTLSEKLGAPFIDLDRTIEKQWKALHSVSMSCREIFSEVGEESFRVLEAQELQKTLSCPTQTVISLGGGTVTSPTSQEALRGHAIIHLTAKQESVYERIMLAGKPAFLSPDENSYESFARVWDERKPIYESLAQITIENVGKVEDVVDGLITSLKNL